MTAMKMKMNNLIDRSVAQIIYMFLYFLGALPMGLFHTLSDAIGNLWFAFDGRHRKVAMDNLKRAFGDTMDDRMIRETARENFRQISRLLFEVGWSLHLTRNDIRNNVKVEGLEHLTRAFARGKGVLFLTGHMGSWELLTLVPALIPFTIHDIYRPLDYHPLESVIMRFRTRFNMKLIAKEGAIRKILKALSRNEGVGIPLDQSVSAKDGVFADFFGYPTCTSKGMGLIAMRTQSPVLSVFMIREDKKFRVVIGPQMTLNLTGDTATDLLEITRRFNQEIEKIIRRYPSQWFWVHNRWKTKPPIGA